VNVTIGCFDESYLQVKSDFIPESMLYAATLALPMANPSDEGTFYFE
jgi:hypothetical protein